MKKIICALSVLFAVSLTACDDGEEKFASCDLSFINGCRDGIYLQCEFASADSKGRIVESATLTYQNITYVCDKNDTLVIKDYTCDNGQLKDAAGKPVAPVCGYNNLFYRCDGSELKTVSTYCADDAVYTCADGQPSAKKCGNAESCVEYERNGHVSAACFPKENVTSGCGDLTTFGACSDKGVLSFCSSSDPKKGKTVTLDCPKEEMACLLVDDKYGYDCTGTCGKDDTGAVSTNFGRCDGDILYYCADDNGKAIPQKMNCADSGQVCGINRSQEFPQNDCMSK